MNELRSHLLALNTYFPIHLDIFKPAINLITFKMYLFIEDDHIALKIPS